MPTTAMRCSSIWMLEASDTYFTATSKEMWTVSRFQIYSMLVGHESLRLIRICRRWTAEDLVARPQ